MRDWRQVLYYPIAWAQVVGPYRSILALIAVLALSKCAAGMLACCHVANFYPGPYLAPWLVLTFGGVALWALRRYPGWAATFAVIGASYASGPIARAGISYPPIEAFIPAILWLAALEHPQPLRGWRLQLAAIPAGASLCIATLAIFGIDTGIFPRLWPGHERLWNSAMPLTAAALVVLLVRNIRPPSLDPFSVLVAIGALPGALHVILWSALPSYPLRDSQAAYVAFNLWISLIPIGFLGLARYQEARDATEQERTT